MTHKLILLNFYPVMCADCPLLGTRPKSELEKGSKYTKICIGFNKPLAGRGTKTEGARCRCGKKKYMKLYFENQGVFTVNSVLLERYQMQQQALQPQPEELKITK